jgi:predicted DNA-binding transcriptional regulator YafY
MSQFAPTPRRPAIRITRRRAARLHRLVALLGLGPRPRADLLDALAVGARTFFRELNLLRRCGVTVRSVHGAYALRGSAEEALGRLPFPDPQLSLAEVAELARGPGAAASRLAALLGRLRDPSASLPPSRRGRPKARPGPAARG